MEKIKTYFISLGISLGMILIFDFFINLFNYFDLLNISVYKVFLIVFIVISSFIGSYLIGRKTTEQGYLEGLKFGIVLSIIMFFLNILMFEFDFKLVSLIYYCIIIFFSILGASVGINKKQEK